MGGRGDQFARARGAAGALTIRERLRLGRRRARAKRRVGARQRGSRDWHGPGRRREGQGEQIPSEQRLANGELLYRNEGLRPRRRRLQRDPREVSEHAELPRRALAPRRDVLRCRTSISPPAATIAELIDKSRDPALPDLLRPCPGASRRREPARWTTSPGSTKSSSGSARSPPRRSTPGSTTPRGRRTSRRPTTPTRSMAFQAVAAGPTTATRPGTFRVSSR